MERSTQALWDPLLSDEDQDALKPEAHTVSYPKGATLMKINEHSDYVVYLRSGHVKSCTSDPRAIFGIHGPGSVLGDLAPLTGEPRSADLVALTPIDVLHIPGDRFIKFLLVNPQTHLAVTQRLAKRVREMSEVQEESFMTSERRLARAMLRIIDSGIGKEGENGLVIAGFTQDDLADLARISRESVSAVIRQFKTRGTIATGRVRFTIRDTAAIEALAMRRDRSLI
ncbi:Crp/Fnr family transcriptional regulator [Glycomyces algeriensis]|nr:Crp/Fnr family transcriptional regulator [Glycomyces algeriensis]MDA1366783.1 Crp/Fnr family transcriptional regulator [Glycomyces algeriensis]MDA1368634.1 Crp/Fnr family transcriptional regulator [Glycomyces algeriensis]MDR7351670.1 CRP-like cAMP-binding protein [Glycomyces algeriensis]